MYHCIQHKPGRKGYLQSFTLKCKRYLLVWWACVYNLSTGNPKYNAVWKHRLLINLLLNILDSIRLNNSFISCLHPLALQHKILHVSFSAFSFRKKMICLKEILIHHAKSNIRWLSVMNFFFGFWKLCSCDTRWLHIKTT